MPESADFDAFYAATAHRLLGQIYAFTGNLGEAEDAVAEAYARAWQRWSTVSAYNDPTGWVRTVAVRISVSSWRRARTRIRAHRRHGPPADAPELTPDRVLLLTALRSVSAEHRRVLVLHHIADLSVEQIAHEIGIPPNTVKTRLHRARAALARCLGEPEEVALNA